MSEAIFEYIHFEHGDVFDAFYGADLGRRWTDGYWVY
jgi:hypothetical protein